MERRGSEPRVIDDNASGVDDEPARVEWRGCKEK